MFVVSPAAILYDQAGTPVAVSPNVAIPAGTSTVLIAGTDGTNARIFSVDANGKLAIQNPSNLDTALSTRLSTSAFTARVNVLGQNNMAGSTPVVLASDQSAIPVTDNGGSITVDGTVTANQGTAAALAGAWPVEVTDGTNTLPTGDAAARSIFTQISDGTTGPVAVKPASTAALAADKSLVTAFSPNSPLPTGTNEVGAVAQGTAAALADYWPVGVTDGTNTMPTMDVAARSGYVRVTDGTNTQPTGDVAARSIFTQVTDGTNGPVAVKPASTSALTTDASLVVQVSPNQDPIPTTVVPATSIAGSAIGRVSGLSANSFVPVRQTTYVEQTTNAQRSIVSTSTNDSAAGTGARQVMITYLNATGAGPFTETVTLNGTTAVNTVATDICFIERMDVVSVGSGGSNVGTLNLYTGTGATGTIFAAIGTGAIATGVGDNQTLYAHHYVPVNYTVTGYYISVGIIAAAGGGSSVTIIRYRNPTSATSPWLLASDIVNAAQGNSTARVYYASIEIPGPLVVAGWVTTANNNSTATCSFDYADAPV